MKNTQVLGVIPARYNSSRFPGKALQDLGGKPVVQWVYETAKTVLTRVIVATEDTRIRRAAQNFGAEVMMTSSRHATGTDRVAEIAKKVKYPWIINLQGDEPFLQPETIQKIAKELQSKKRPLMVTAATPLKKGEAENPNTAKVLLSQAGKAIYFSRVPLPGAFKHVSIYGYSKNFLLKFQRMPQTALEKLERLEQLRAIENGIPIHIVKVDQETIGIDIPEDLEKARLFIRRIQKLEVRIEK